MSRNDGRGDSPISSNYVGNNGPSDADSAAHRRKLEEMFGGKSNGATASTSPPRTAPRGKVFASPRRSVGRSPSDYRLRLERLRIAREDEEIKEAADAFLAHHQLPDDLDILYKLMRHPSEKVLREAMGQISALLMQGRVPSLLLLQDRLQEVEGRAQEDGTRSYIEGLRSQIRQLQGA